MFALTERRLSAEWALLEQLAAVNAGRLTGLRRDGAEFHTTLHGPSAMSIPRQQHGDCLFVHDLRVEFPVHFPAVPMEMYLRIPVVHPNVHPETGFVCLWERHRVSNSVELALHRLVAMLAGTLCNDRAPHVMQPDALPCEGGPAMPLQGVAYEAAPYLDVSASSARRRRLL
ncbi:ubiquitin-conjugating enzyme E2 variant [Terriglobus sp.]|uniref:ubiquitin-conjugating enzyme E2 variant n=1 Tax=Terriglobus sp. TaxID=1889013 RepID=UPI003AFF8D49